MADKKENETPGSPPAPAAKVAAAKAPDAPAPPRDGTQTLKDGQTFDRGRTEPLTDAQKDKAAFKNSEAKEGDSENDRFAVQINIKNPLFKSAGLIFRNGWGYTGDPKVVNICRSLGYKVIDRHKHPSKKDGE
jgi:hypothetical protein